MTVSSYTRAHSSETKTFMTNLITGQKVTTSLVPHHHTWVDSVNRGAQLPGWRKRLRDGLDATTSLSGYESSVRLTTGYAKINNVGGWSEELTGAHSTMEAGPPSQDPALLDVSKANAEALGRFNQAIRQTRTTFEGGVFIGELGQTIRMFRNPAMGLRKLTDEFLDIARAIRRKPIRNALGQINLHKITEHLSDAWLEVSFGWRPLLHDVRDGCKALDELTAGQSLKTIGISRSFKVDSPFTTTTTVRTASACTWLIETSVQGHCTVTYRGAMRVKARDPGSVDVAKFGFDPASFAPTVWELIPYSFLIDYFTNVGDVITGVSNLFSELSWCNSTTRRWYSSEVVSKKPSPSPYSTFTSAKAVCTKKHVLRAKYEGILVPGFTTRVPRIGSLRWLNIAALIGSRNADRRWSYD